MLALLVISILAATDGPRQSEQTPLQVRCDALFKEFTDSQVRYIEATHKAKTDDEARRFSAPNGRDFAARFMAMAREHPDDPAAADALSRALMVDLGGPVWKEAIGQIRARHIKSPRIGQAVRCIAFDTTPPDVEPLLRAVLQENPEAEVRAQAALALAEHLQRLVGEAENMRKHPDRFERAAAQFGRADTTRIRDRDLTVMRRESESLYDSVTREYASIRGPAGQSPAEQATSALRRIRDLVVGSPAPEIEGKDIDGRPMKLSDYRGKVVALVFWATWCGPCMAEVPHERELIRRMEGKPFVLLGVNSDEGRERLKHQVKEKDIPWRSFVDGGPDGPISTRWNVKGWPTVFVIDAGGVIRAVGNLRGEELDAAVEKLVAAAH